MSVAEQWERWFSDFAERWPPKLERFFEEHPDKKKDFNVWKMTRSSREVPSPAIERFTLAAPADVEWLASALRDDRKRWFVERLVARRGVVPEPLFEPMLDAACQCQDPSFGPKCFVAPCARAFGSQRVVAYLVGVAESATDPALVIGALDALYTYGIAKDIVERRKTFLLEAAVGKNTSTYVRHRLVTHLRLDEPAKNTRDDDRKHDRDENP